MRHAAIPGAVSAIVKLSVKTPLSAAVCLEEVTLSQRKEQSIFGTKQGREQPSYCQGGKQDALRNLHFVPFIGLRRGQTGEKPIEIAYVHSQAHTARSQAFLLFSAGN